MVPNVAVERSGWAVRHKGGSRGQQGGIRSRKITSFFFYKI